MEASAAAGRSTYAKEAQALLDAEFVWFSEADVHKVLDLKGQSFTQAWHALNDAEANGLLAAHPLSSLRDARGRACLATEADVASVSDAELRSELATLVEWRAREKREFQSWANSLFYSADRDGKEQLLDADGKQVMMEWERPYMQGCVDALSIGPDSHVLEIGFGCAYSANRIQGFAPKSHTIVECSEVVLQRLRTWAADKPSVRVVEGTWQQMLPELGIFDCIFFDDYGAPGLAEREMDLCPDERYRDAYAKSLSRDHGTHFLAFVELALRWHSRPGTRLSGYLEYPLRDEMVPEDVKVEYDRILVKPPPHCNYFPTDPRLCEHALIPLFTKRGLLEDESTESAGALSSFSRSSSVASGSRSRSRSRSPLRP